MRQRHQDHSEDGQAPDTPMDHEPHHPMPIIIVNDISNYNSSPTTMAPASPHIRSQCTSSKGDMAVVLVGPKQDPFVVNRRLLCDVSPIFRELLQKKMHSSPSPSNTVSSCSSSLLSPGSCQQTTFYSYKSVMLWLPGESTAMFGLFVHWLHARSSFCSFLDGKTAQAHTMSDQRARVLHWALIRLHLFAARLGLDMLQDQAMDTIQDLYLRRDWDIAPSVVAYLYTSCEARQAERLRRWAVAMVVFSLAVAWHAKHQRRQDAVDAGGHGESDNPRHPSFQPHQRTASLSSSSLSSPACDPARLHSMLDALPEFAADYVTHVASMNHAHLNMRIKNPQLRIPTNALHSSNRVFGFRECSFHSHRAAVGQGPCPHSLPGWRRADTVSISGLDSRYETTHEQVPYEQNATEEECDGDDETSQWEKEWAGEYLDLDYSPPDHSCLPSTGPEPLLQPPAPPEDENMGESMRPVMSRFGQLATGLAAVGTRLRRCQYWVSARAK